MNPSTQTILATLFMVAVESGLLIFASRRQNSFRLRGLSVMNMIVISMFSKQLIDLQAGISNVPNICYATVVCSQAIILARANVSSMRTTIPMVNFSLSTIFLITLCLGYFPIVDGNSAFVKSMNDIIEHTPDVVVASFMAFFCAQECMWRAWKRLRTAHGAVVSMVLASWFCQAIDTPVFFALALGRTTQWAQLTEMMSIGLLFKCALAILFIPAFVICTNMPRSLTDTHARIRSHLSFIRTTKTEQVGSGNAKIFG